MAVTTPKIQTEHSSETCNKKILPIKDAVEIIKGTWKLPIIGALFFGDKRFKEISKSVGGITDKMLSKELKDLEMNQLITRTVYDSFPPIVEYSITEHGRSLEKVIKELEEWGIMHREKITGKKSSGKKS